MLRLRSAVIDFCKQNDFKIMVAEGCTSGILAHHLSIPFDASTVFYGGVITYNKAMKYSMLGVDHVLIEDGSTADISEICAIEMADNLREKYNNYSKLITISTTGNLKPLLNRDSSVYYAISIPGKVTKCYTFNACNIVSYESNADQCVLHILRTLISIFESGLE